MSANEAIRTAAETLSTRTWMSFADLESETGLSRDQIIAHKAEIETALRRRNPDVRLTSRVDLHPQGFEIGE